MDLDDIRNVVILAGLFIILSGYVIFLLGKAIDTDSKEKIKLGIYEIQASKLIIFSLAGGALVLGPLVLSPKLNNNSDDFNCIDNSMKKNTQKVNFLEEELAKCQQKNESLIENKKFNGKSMSEENIAEEKCKLIANKKSFVFPPKYEYTFTDENFTETYDIRAIAVEGGWDIDNDSSCKSKNGDRYLKGKDFSKHRIEIREKGKGEFKSIGIATSQYNSKVHISEEGKLGHRSIYPPDLMRFIPNPGIAVTDEIREKVCRYDKFRRDKHNLTAKSTTQESKATKSQPCDTTIGEKNNRIMMVFVCTDYNRVMVQNDLNDDMGTLRVLDGLDLSCQK